MSALDECLLPNPCELSPDNDMTAHKPRWPCESTWLPRKSIESDCKAMSLSVPRKENMANAHAPRVRGISAM